MTIYNPKDACEADIILKGHHKCTTPEVKEWQMYTEPTEGHFYHLGDLKDLKLDFLKQDICPRVSMRSLFDIRKLCVSVGKQKCHIYSLPRFHEAIFPVRGLKNLAFLGTERDWVEFP